MEGGCTCGDVRYRLHDDPMIIHCCHCAWCQREPGSAFAINAVIETERLELIAGAAERLRPVGRVRRSRGARPATSLSGATMRARAVARPMSASAQRMRRACTRPMSTSLHRRSSHGWRCPKACLPSIFSIRQAKAYGRMTVAHGGKRFSLNSPDRPPRRP